MTDDSISRQAAVDALIAQANHEGAYGYIDAKEAEDVLMALPSSPRWIPVTERVPKERVNVLITYIIGNDRYTAENCIEDGKWGIEGLRFLYPDIEVLAWMQKPTPWEGDRR